MAAPGMHGDICRTLLQRQAGLRIPDLPPESWLVDRTRAGRQVEYPKARLYGDYSTARRALQDAKECVAYDEPAQALECAERAITLAIAFRDSIAGRIAEGEQIWGRAPAEAV
jgi:hypothetical protein